MNIFEIFEDRAVEVENFMMNAIDGSVNEVSLEITELAKKHNVEMTRAFADELASLFTNPPPWSPWTK